MAIRTQGPSYVSWSAKDVANLNTIATAEFGSAYNAAIQKGYSEDAAQSVAYQAAKQVTDVVTNRAAAWGMTPSDVISQRGQFQPVTKYGTIENVEAKVGTDPNVAAMVSQRLGELKAGLPTRDFSYFDNPDAVKAMVDRHEASLDSLARSEWGLTAPGHLDVNVSPAARHNAYSLENDNIPGNITMDIQPDVHQQFDIPTDLGFFSALNSPVENAQMANLAAQQAPTGWDQAGPAEQTGRVDTGPAPTGAAIDAWGGWSNPAENMGRIDTAAAAVPNFGQNETNYGPSYEGWSNPADASRTYGVSPDMTGYTTGGQFGTPADGYGFGQGFGDAYAGGTVNGLDTPSESRAAPPAQPTDAWGGWSNPAETIGRVDAAQPAPTPDVESAFANAPAPVTSEPLGAPAADAESEQTGRVDTAKAEPAPQSSVAEGILGAATPDTTATPATAVAPTMAAGMVPGGYGAYGALQSGTEFGAVPSMVNAPAIGFGPDDNAPAPMAPSITGMPGYTASMGWGDEPAAAEAAAEPAQAQTAPSIAGMPGWAPQTQNWSFPSWNEPSLAEPQQGTEFAGYTPQSFNWNYSIPSWNEPALAEPSIDTTPTSSVADMGGWGGFGGNLAPGAVADTGTFGGMYGPGQMASRGDWSGDVATSGPGLMGALSDAAGSTNWAGSWNGVDQTGQNLGWGPAGMTQESMASAAKNATQGGTAGGFYGPSGQSISAETSMFGGPGAPLGTSTSASRGLAGLFGGWSSQGTGGWGGGADNGGGEGDDGEGDGGSSNGHSSMGDASY